MVKLCRKCKYSYNDVNGIYRCTKLRKGCDRKDHKIRNYEKSYCITYFKQKKVEDMKKKCVNCEHYNQPEKENTVDLENAFCEKIYYIENRQGGNINWAQQCSKFKVKEKNKEEEKKMIEKIKLKKCEKCDHCKPYKNHYYCHALSEYKNWKCSGENGEYELNKMSLDHACEWWYDKSMFKEKKKRDEKVSKKECDNCRFSNHVNSYGMCPFAENNLCKGLYMDGTPKFQPRACGFCKYLDVRVINTETNLNGETCYSCKKNNYVWCSKKHVKKDCRYFQNRVEKKEEKKEEEKTTIKGIPTISYVRKDVREEEIKSGIRELSWKEKIEEMEKRRKEVIETDMKALYSIEDKKSNYRLGGSMTIISRKYLKYIEDYITSKEFKILKKIRSYYYDYKCYSRLLDNFKCLRYGRKKIVDIKEEKWLVIKKALQKLKKYIKLYEQDLKREDTAAINDGYKKKYEKIMGTKRVKKNRCSKCGLKLRKDAIFCHSCGARR